MKGRKLIALIIAAIGAIMLLFSNNIAAQVALGRTQISEGQQQVDTVNSLFGTSSYTKPIGNELTRSGQKRINEGTAEADYYQNVSNMLKIAGIVLIVIGAGAFFFWKKR
jgi:hypothetical protein